jgi:aspartate aminotransferase
MNSFVNHDLTPFVLNRSLARVSPSPLFALIAKAKDMTREGRKIISLSAGEPDFDTPSHITDAAIAALKAGETRYTAVTGTLELRSAIANKVSIDHGVNYPVNQIIATTGAKQALFNLCAALLNAGDEVIIPAPYWPSYVDMVRLQGAHEVIVQTGSDSNFTLSAAALRKSITQRTKLIFLNSPGNPSGSTYSATQWRALARVLEDYRTFALLTIVFMNTFILVKLRCRVY